MAAAGVEAEAVTAVGVEVVLAAAADVDEAVAGPVELENVVVTGRVKGGSVEEMGLPPLLYLHTHV